MPENTRSIDLAGSGVACPAADAARGRRSRAPAADAAAIPCLSSNNSTEWASNRLSTQQRKSATALAINVACMAEKWGLQHLGFLTLTFADHVTDFREAQRRFNSLASHQISSRYAAWLGVWERQKSGRIHFHLLVVVPFDIRTGFDWEDIEKGCYKSASPAIRAEWAYWRRTSKAYGFGRTELLPVRSTSEGIARYVGKYIGKHLDQRIPEDKGARLVRYSRAARTANTRFSWNTPGAKLWRSKVRQFAYLMARLNGCCPTMSGLADALGPRWAYNWREFIMALPDSDSC